MTDEFIWIVPSDDMPVISMPNAGSKGLDWGDEIDRHTDPVATKGVRLKVADLQAKMTEFLQVLGGVFQQAEAQATPEMGMKLTEVEVSVEISGEGEIKLVTGIKAGATGAIKLKFTRVSS